MGGADLAFAFGVSPPWLTNDHLVPGAQFEQTIILTQPEASRPLGIDIDMQVPEIIKDWIIIEPGMRFTIPEGKRQYPMKITVNVPKDAAYETYLGDIIVLAVTGGGGGQVSIITGAAVKVKLRVSGEEFSDFKLKRVKVPDIEEGDPIKVEIELKNLGNVKIRPSKVYLEIYDQYHKTILKRGEAGEMNFIAPFKTGKVIAKMPVKLEIDEYWAEIEIYKEDELILKDKRIFQIVEKGTLGLILGLAVWVWILIAGIILAIFLGFKFGLWKKLLAKFGIVIKVEKTPSTGLGQAKKVKKPRTKVRGKKKKKKKKKPGSRASPI